MNFSQHPVGGRRLIPSSAYKARRGGMSETSRWREEKAGIGPRPVKVNGRNFYFEDEADAYLDRLAAARHDVGEAVADDEAARIAATCTNEGATED